MSKFHTDLGRFIAHKYRLQPRDKAIVNMRKQGIPWSLVARVVIDHPEAWRYLALVQGVRYAAECLRTAGYPLEVAREVLCVKPH